MLMRGGMEPYGATVLAFAAECGLEVTDWYEPVEDAGGIVRALTDTDGAPIVHLRRFLPDQVITEINAGSTAVLANSGHEPFGLVGLEAMAAGGVAMVGATGEGYARPYGNAIVVETDDPAEISSALRGLVGVRVELPANQPVVLLREEDGVRYLPIWIGAVEASAIAFQQQGVQTLRPLTHDLLRDVISALGVRLEAVHITELRDDVYYAELRFTGGVTVSARPSPVSGMVIDVVAVLKPSASTTTSPVQPAWVAAVTAPHRGQWMCRWCQACSATAVVSKPTSRSGN